jgi:glycine hydroxymethyltransferase
MKKPFLQKQDTKVYQALIDEELRQREGLEMIASENYVSEAVLETLGSVFTNKYSEGYPGKRYYGGQEYTDVIESLAIERAKKIFGAEHANVQPLSGAPANVAAYAALLEPGDCILGMDLSHGGHLTHGHPATVMTKVYRFVRYKTEADGSIDYDKLMKLAKKEKPKLILAGFSSYTRNLDYEKITAIAKSVGARSMMDMAHIAGLVAAKVVPTPVPYFDVVTLTTHKSLRGPRGGMILCKQEFAKAIDKAVFPGLQGGPHMNNIAAKAVAFGEVLKPSFKKYGRQMLKNAKALEKVFRKHKGAILFGGTENHMIMLDVMTTYGITGRAAEERLDAIGITINKNVIPDDPRGPMDPSGIRVGVPALTTRGMKEDQVKQIAEWMHEVLASEDPSEVIPKIRQQVIKLCKNFPVPKEFN